MSGVVGRRAERSTGSTSTRRRSTGSTRRRERTSRCRCPNRSAASRSAPPADSSSRCAAGSGSRARDGALTRKLADAPYDPSHHRFNDGRCDAQGRFFAGTMNERRDAPTGALVRIDPSGGAEPVLGEMTISNGLAWSPDGRTMYHADTPTRTISAYDFDAATGTPSRGRVFAQFAAETDRPDGAAVDRNGSYWSAFYRGGKVVRLSPAGAVQAEYPLAAQCPTMCAFGGDDLQDALRDHRAPAPRRRRARAPAAFRRHFRHARRRARASRAQVRRLTRALRSRHVLQFDSTAFLRLDAPQCVGTSASGAAFATSTGDVLEVTCFGPGVFRLRAGPNTRPDYGLILGKAQACDVAQTEDGAFTFSSGDAVLEIAGSPLQFRLRHRDAQVLGIDDRRALPRLHPAADLRARPPGRPVDRRVGARLGRGGVRARRKVRTARQARTDRPFAGRRRARRQHRTLVQERSVRLEPRRRQGRVGRLRAYDRHGRARRRVSRLVAPLVRDARRRRGARPVRVRGGHAGGDPRRLHETHRPGAGRAAVEPRPVDLARPGTRRPRRPPRSRGNSASARSPATC